MRQEFARLRDRWGARHDSPKIEIGIGLNTGTVFVGLLGSAKRVNYTVIGDNVNLAARLQDLTKEYQWHILISESTDQQVKDEFETEFLETRMVKGKTTPVAVYRVLGTKGSPAGQQAWAS